MSEKRWTCQPDEVEQATPIARFTVRAAGESKIVEIREVAVSGPYYMSVGNIFGQDTLRVDTLRSVLTLIDRLGKLEDGQQVNLSGFRGVRMLPSLKVD